MGSERTDVTPKGVPSAQAAGSAQAPAETLHAGTQLVIVDVVVQDRSGHPIHGLTRDNFTLTEQKKPQAIRHFEEHSATSDKKPGPPMPPMPPGVFTNYTPVAPDSTLNVLLIDALNTPMTDQAFVRQQLLDYIKHEKPGTDVAIFGLTNRLVMLQGFSADPAVLRAAVAHLNSKASSLLDDPVGSGSGPEKLSDAMQDDALSGGAAAAEVAQVVASLQQFEAEQQAFQTKMRTQYTLDAFNALAHYLANFPGRKNLIWFSGSFPLQIEPDPTLNDPFAVMADSNEEFRETTNLLTLAQTAVYPVDARGLMTAPMFSAANSGSKYARNPSAFSNDLMKFNQSQAQEHTTMEQMASDTGGHAFYNTNGLASAVEKAIEAGSNYYTLTYTPTDHNWNGSYRNIHVELAGNAAAQGLKLEYRHGFYADDPQQPPKLKRGELPARATPTAPGPAALADHAAEAYSHAAVSRGAPAPQDILFKVRVVPLTGKNDDTLAPGNLANPNGKMKAPYRTFAVDYVALPGDFSVVPQKDGRRTGEIEFSTFIYDADGNLLNISNRKAFLNLDPATYKQFISSPVRLQLMVSAPVKQESFMRLIIHDLPSNHYGVVEIPTAEVGHLPPLEAQNAPANVSKPPAGPAPQPTGKQ
ncbi:MAG TPA: VWA domain-containing protein [Acidobacteriaceae bacterium]|nr:VWA domain-containing protein [Acidobacteriaceae bacterium]